jgi:phage tail-like protein
MPQAFEFNLTFSGPDGDGVYPLPEGESILGRQPGVQLLLDHPQVSRQHARIGFTGAECSLTDLNSSNGTYVDGKKLIPGVPEILQEGAAILIGPFKLVLEKVALPDGPVPEEEPAAPLPVEASAAPILTREQGPTPERESTDGKEEKSTGGRRRERLSGQAGPPPPDAMDLPAAPPGGETLAPPGLGRESTRLIRYLPGIYQTEFMARFLGIFESILMPIEWTIDNFDLYLSPATAPAGFLSWLANLYQIALGPGWDEARRRAVLGEASQIFARNGTRWALSRVLEIYTGLQPVIEDGAELDPHTFRVRLPAGARSLNRENLQALIDAIKPAHTAYILDFDPPAGR